MPKVCGIKTIDEKAASGLLKEVYQSIAGKSGGVAHILKSQSLHPSALKNHYGLYRTLMFGPSPLSRAEREMVAVVVSATNGCHY